MALCRGLCSPGETKYAARIVSIKTNGTSQVCRRHSRLQRPRNLLVFLRFRPRSLPFFAKVGLSTAGGVADLRPDVASALAPVSPRGSAPRVELLRCRRAVIPFGLCVFCVGVNAGKASVFCEDAIARRRSDWKSKAHERGGSGRFQCRQAVAM